MDNYSLSVGVIVIKDSKVLLVKHNYGSANGKYLNPGGFLKDGELPEEAAVREIFEETGVKIITSEKSSSEEPSSDETK